MNKLYFGIVPQNGTLSTRIFDSQKTLEDCIKAHPDKLTKDNTGWVDAKDVDTSRFTPISSVEEFNQQPADRGDHNESVGQQSVTSLGGQSV